MLRPIRFALIDVRFDCGNGKTRYYCKGIEYCIAVIYYVHTQQQSKTEIILLSITFRFTNGVGVLYVCYCSREYKKKLLPFICRVCADAMTATVIRLLLTLSPTQSHSEISVSSVASRFKIVDKLQKIWNRLSFIDGRIELEFMRRSYQILSNNTIKLNFNVEIEKDRIKFLIFYNYENEFEI